MGTARVFLTAFMSRSPCATPHSLHFHYMHAGAMCPTSSSWSRQFGSTGASRIRRTGTLDVTFADDQMRARTAHAGHNLAVLKRLMLNMIRLDPVKRKTMRILAASSDDYRAHLLGLG